MYKTIFSNIGKYKKQAILTPVTIIGEVLMEVLIPAVMAMIIDNGVDKGDRGPQPSAVQSSGIPPFFDSASSDFLCASPSFKWFPL